MHELKEGDVELVDKVEASVLDCQGLSGREITERLRTVDAESVRLIGVPDNVHGIASGVELDANVELDGSAGDFSLLLGSIANFEISQDVGHVAGHSMVSGRLLVRGSAGHGFASYARGGFLVVHGHAGDRCGAGLAGADVLIRATVGDQAGCGMQEGVLVLGNGAGQDLGAKMIGGTIYVRGDVKSVSPDIASQRLKDADSMRLSLLLARAGIKGAGGQGFKVYRARSR